jgi:1-acyl-sn-glycerol-3-phosphate acyltransferase
MTDESRVQGPAAEEIERRFRHPAVLAARPVILGGIGALSVVRRFGWTGIGADRLRAHDGPLIFAANHASHADTAAILGTLPRSIRRRTCVAAALDVFGPASNGERRSWHAFRRECLQIVVAAGFHAFAFDRHGPPRRSLRTAVTLVRRGWSLLLYPEGTRSRTGRIGPFKAGVGVLAKMTGRPVVPIHVGGGTTILPCGSTVPRSGRAVVRFGDAVRLAPDESAAAFTQRLHGRIRELGGLGAADAPRDAVEAIPAGNAREQSA